MAYQTNKINTTGLTLFDENGVMLRLGYLDDSLSLMIGEPKKTDSGKNEYPQELRYSFLITMDRAAALYQNIIIDKVLPAIESSSNYDGGIFLNRKKNAVLDIIVKDGDIYLAYYKDINEDRKPESTHLFKFQKTSIIEHYNPNGDDDFKINDAIHGYFTLFVKYLEAGVFDGSSASVHAFRKTNYYTTTKIFNYLEALAAKLGVTLENRSYNNTNTNPSGFINTTGTEEEIPFEPEQTVSSLTELI